MVTDSLVKKKFVHETLQEGILKIYSTQENVVRNHYKRRTGRLLTTLSCFSVSYGLVSCLRNRSSA